MRFLFLLTLLIPFLPVRSMAFTYNLGAFWQAPAATGPAITYIKASNTDANDRFGHSVSVFGDTLAVSAVGESSSATGVNGDQSDNSVSWSGAVYVFTRSGGTWSQHAYVKASNTEADDRFGHSVSLYGDTLAVGAAGEDSSATGVNGNQSDNSASGLELCTSIRSTKSFPVFMPVASVVHELLSEKLFS